MFQSNILTIYDYIIKLTIYFIQSCFQTISIMKDGKANYGNFTAIPVYRFINGRAHNRALLFIDGE